ncbi:hypothetical protein [Bifidobacterium longum]|uniref:hypothetical protein n=1 Tax=Bifidobacterium longum TaxID=216816 RepID=UPI0004D4EB96|nr:hypothetical protein [Bifidobacterium longum]KEY33093.1 hypothetical protein EK13BL_10850 [Bifidobacterium longum subsp. longum EK13]
MDIDEPVKTFNGETVREATYPIVFHISASLYNSSTDYDLGEMEVDMPINLEPTASADGSIAVIPKIDSKSFLKRLTDGANAFIEAFNA